MIQPFSAGLKMLVLSTDSCSVPVATLLFVHSGDPASQSSLCDHEEKEWEVQIHVSEYPLFELCNGALKTIFNYHITDAIKKIAMM